MVDEMTFKTVLTAELTRIGRMLVYHDLDTLESVLIRLERMYGYLVHINDNGLVPSVVNDEFLDMVRTLLNIIVSICEDPEEECDNDNHLTTITSRRRGGPKYDLPEEQLVYFLDHGFSCTKISRMMGVSLRTVRRRMS